MPRYHSKTKKRSEDSGYESGYESDEGTEYFPKRILGTGDYAQARLFKSKTGKKITVLNPVKTPDIDFGEATIKYRFFHTIYPDAKSHLFDMGIDYRLVVPYISYTPYDDLEIDTPELQQRLFCSAVRALQDCHNKGLIVLDLKMDNIYYDYRTSKSYLIDGGLSTLTGTAVDPYAFQKDSQEIVDKFKEDYDHIPPECWSVAPTSVAATSKMDIYCLGILMRDLIETPTSEIQLLIEHCLDENPDNRPTLEELLISLDSVNSENTPTLY